MGVAPVLMPALGKAALGFVAGSGGSVIKQVIQNKMKGDKAMANIDWAQAAKTGAKGAAFGAIMSVLGTGLSNIGKAVGEVVHPSESITKEFRSINGDAASRTVHSKDMNFGKIYKGAGNINVDKEITDQVGNQSHFNKPFGNSLASASKPSGFKLGGAAPSVREP